MDSSVKYLIRGSLSTLRELQEKNRHNTYLHEIEKHLKKICYPTKKEIIIVNSLNSYAPYSVIEILCRLEDKEYKNIESILREIFEKTK